MMNTIKNYNPLVVALDVPTFEEARALIEQLGDSVEIFKVGSQLFTHCGPGVVRYLMSKDRQVFLDLKFHDIPNTVANAVEAAVSLGQEINRSILMYTVHIEGGEAMLKATVEATIRVSQKLKIKPPLILGITVLTSTNSNTRITQLVLDRAQLAKSCGLNGVVASVEEVEMIKENLGKDFIVVTPGIRPAGETAGDQQRISTPTQAIQKGSNFLVVGRPIVKSSHPHEAALNILKEIKSAQ